MALLSARSHLLTSKRTECEHLVVVGSNEWTAIGDVVTRLKASYPDVAPDTVTTVVHHNHARFDGSPVRDYVPLLVERGSRRALAELGS
jgi:hypothetical protein